MTILPLCKMSIMGVLANLQNAVLSTGTTNYTFEFIYPQDNETQDNIVCMVHVDSVIVVELAYDTCEVIFYDNLAQVHFYDLTLLVNTFHEFMRNEIVTNLRANIIDAISRVPVV